MILYSFLRATAELLVITHLQKRIPSATEEKPCICFAIFLMSAFGRHRFSYRQEVHQKFNGTRISCRKLPKKHQRSVHKMAFTIRRIQYSARQGFFIGIMHTE